MNKSSNLQLGSATYNIHDMQLDLSRVYENSGQNSWSTVTLSPLAKDLKTSRSQLESAWEPHGQTDTSFTTIQNVPVTLANKQKT